MKTIVTHISVDQDAVASAWLVKRYMPEFADAEIMFVSAGKTLDDKKPDEDPDVIHVDTGLGRFDHHQLTDPTQRFSATERVLTYLKNEGHLRQHDVEALQRMTDHITQIDHFKEVFYPDPTADRYDFMLRQIIDGMKINRMKDEDIVKLVFKCLDAIFLVIRQKIAAEGEISKGYIFESKWGKTIAMDTKNEEALKHALKSGYRVVIKRDPNSGHFRIKSLPVKEIDLTLVYEILLTKDPKATWYLHGSKHMLLNGSSKRPDSIASSLSLPQVIEIIRSIN